MEICNQLTVRIVGMQKRKSFFRCAKLILSPCERASLALQLIKENEEKSKLLQTN